MLDTAFWERVLGCGPRLLAAVCVLPGLAALASKTLTFLSV